MSVSQLARDIKASPTLAMNERARILREKGEPVIHLGAGEPKSKVPFDAVMGCATKLKTADIRYTPTEGIPSLIKAIVRYTEDHYDKVVGNENVLVTAGAKQAIYNLLMTIINPQDEVVIFAPYWVSYPEMMTICGAKSGLVTPSDPIAQPTIDDFKKALTDVGQMRIFRPFFPRRELDVLDQVIQAVKQMSRNRVGALIVFERRNPLRSYTGTGTPLDATVTAEMVRTIFTPFAPLHDGALIVSGERLVAAGCILPLTDNAELSRELGTRHRAAIGVTEETDAVVVVVSEETGIISLVSDGQIARGLKPEQLRRDLERLLDLYGEAAHEEPLHESD